MSPTRTQNISAARQMRFSTSGKRDTGAELDFLRKHRTSRLSLHSSNAPGGNVLESLSDEVIVQILPGRGRCLERGWECRLESETQGSTIGLDRRKEVVRSRAWMRNMLLLSYRL
jgi:hypothetical protein